MRSIDIPQANTLDSVRLVVHSIDLGVRRIETLSDFTGFSLRHTGYRLHAARIIGLVSMDGDDAYVTALGERLLCTDPQSEAERAVFYDAIQGSAVIQLLVPELLSLVPPTTEVIAERLFTQSKLGKATALRRAGGLMSWRRYVFGDAPTPHRPRRKSRKPAPMKSESTGEQLSLF